MSNTSSAVPAFIDVTDYRCPGCQGALHQPDACNFACTACRAAYPIRRGQPDFRLETVTETPHAVQLDDTEAWQNRIKHFLRKSPALYRFLVYTIGPALLLEPSSQAFINQLGPQARVLSIGSGVLRLKGQVTHLDYEPYPHLEVVGDAHHLPFPENTFDGVVCESLLEHVLEPEQVIAEMHRVLKPGGKVYVLMPFMFGLHAAPNDFQRFTHKGLLHRMRAFETEQLKVISGPASALTSVLVEFLAILLSFGIQPLYRFWSLALLVLLAPLKLLDVVLSHHPEAVRIASILLFIGVKK